MDLKRFLGDLIEPLLVPSGFGHPEWDHHLKGNLDVVCFFNTDNLSERFSDFPEMPKVDYLAYPNSSDYLA